MVGDGGESYFMGIIFSTRWVFSPHELINQKLRPKRKSRAWLCGGKDRDINGPKAEGMRVGGCWARSGTSKEVSVAGGE